MESSKPSCSLPLLHILRRSDTKHLLLLLTCLCFLLTRSVLGVEWYVSPDGKTSAGCGSTEDTPCTLPFALENVADGDVILLTLGVYEVYHAQEAYDLGSKSLTIRSLSGPQVTNISCAVGQGKLIVVTQTKVNQTLTIDGISFQNCQSGSSGDSALFILNLAQLTISNSVFQNNDNQEMSNTLIYVEHVTTVNIINTTFQENVGRTSLSLKTISDFSIVNSQFKSLVAGDVALLSGGFVVSNSTGTVSGTKFIDNNFLSAVGSAIGISDGSVVKIENSFFINGRASQGVVAVGTKSEVTIESCQFTGTTGSGVYVEDATVYVNQTEFMNCHSQKKGGAILSVSSYLDVGNSFFQGSSAHTSGAAILLTGAGTEGKIHGCSFSHNGQGYISNPMGTVTLEPGGDLTIWSSEFVENIGETGSDLYLSPNSRMTIIDSVFIGTSSSAGSIYSSGTLVVNSSVFQDLKASQQGGAIYSQGGQLTSNNNVFANCLSSGGGGAIYSRAATTVFNSTFVGCEADNYGSAILIETGSSTTVSTILDSTFDKNRCSRYGGAIFMSDPSTQSTISGCTFTNNYAAAAGAAVWVKALGVLKNSFFYNNTAPLGGAVWCQYDVTIHNCTFVRNRAESPNSSQPPHGGALFVKTSINTAIVQSYFDGNSAESEGGAIRADRIIVQDSTFTNNWAGDAGGAVYVIYGASMTESNFYHNLSPSGSAILIEGSPSIDINPLTNLIGCIFEKNVATSATLGSVVFATGSSLLTVQHCNFTSNNGTVGSAIGVNSQQKGKLLYPTTNITDSTFYGNYGQIGGALYFTDATAIVNGSIFANNFAYNSIEAAGGAAFLDFQSYVIFHRCLFENNTVDGDEGSGGAVFYNTGSGKITESEFYQNFASSGGAVSIFDGIEVFGCRFAGNNATLHGGAMYVRTSVNASYCYFTSNTAFDGGGIYLQGQTSITASASSLIDHCTFAENTVDNSGGAINFIGSNPGSSVVIDSSNFIHNLALFANGGAVNLLGDSTITGSYFFNNSAYAGGAMYLDTGKMSCVDLVFLNNSANSTGGGMMIADNPSSFACTSCKFENNNATTGGGVHSDCGSTEPFFEESQFINNVAFDSGGGVYAGIVSSPIIENSIISGNTASSYGGGVASLGNFVFLRLTSIINNTAGAGGGVMVTILPTDNLVARQVATTPLISDVAFEECNISSNFASTVGGGIYVGGDGPWSFGSTKAVIVNSTVQYNFAGSSGGGMALQYWIGGAVASNVKFIQNEAIISGGAVFFSTLTNNASTDYNSFCTGCTYSMNEDVQGYQTPDGTATIPVYSSLQEPPPNTLELSNLTFSASLVLLDGFNTSVKGGYLNATSYTASASVVDQTACTMLNALTVPINPNTGSALFAIRLLSYANRDCSLRFSTDPPTNLITTTISIAGCPSGYAIIVNPGTNYQECKEEDPLTLVYIILIAVGSVVVVLFLVFIISRYRRWKVRHTEIPDFAGNDSRPSLQDILADPLIPRISWEEIELKERIGIGATGVVHRAVWWNNRDPIEVAVKQLTLSRHTLTSPTMDNFLVEIKFLSSIDHPNVVKLLGIASPSENELNIVMELMQRGNLRDLIVMKSKNLTFEMKMKLATEAAEGMEYLHNCKVIHRDLKPENLLVDQDWTCKVGDLGMSTIKPKIERTMTQIGTPLYVAPEVFSKGRYSEKADVFSFAIVLLELYTCSMPFAAPPYDQMLSSEIMFKVINENLRPPVPTDCPLPLTQLIYDCWDPSPDRRPSFTEIVARLNRILR